MFNLFWRWLKGEDAKVTEPERQPPKPYQAVGVGSLETQYWPYMKSATIKIKDGAGIEVGSLYLHFCEDCPGDVQERMAYVMKTLDAFRPKQKTKHKRKQGNKPTDTTNKGDE